MVEQGRELVLRPVEEAGPADGVLMAQNSQSLHLSSQGSGAFDKGPVRATSEPKHAKHATKI